MKTLHTSLVLVAVTALSLLGGCISVKRDAAPSRTTTTTTTAPSVVAPTSTTVQRTTTY